jgi:hypothetical protein
MVLPAIVQFYAIVPPRHHYQVTLLHPRLIPTQKEKERACLRPFPFEAMRDAFNDNMAHLVPIMSFASPIAWVYSVHATFDAVSLLLLV